MFSSPEYPSVESLCFSTVVMQLISVQLFRVTTLWQSIKSFELQASIFGGNWETETIKTTKPLRFQPNLLATRLDINFVAKNRCIEWKCAFDGRSFGNIIPTKYVFHINRTKAKEEVVHLEGWKMFSWTGWIPQPFKGFKSNYIRFGFHFENAVQNLAFFIMGFYFIPWIPSLSAVNIQIKLNF